MFKKIFVEKAIQNNQATKNILKHFKTTPIIIEKIEKIFGKVRKPYLDKRNNLNLFIGEKKGNLLKKAPPAYGNEKGNKHQLHYYFIHSYNCIYECEYCYLQGYFHSPDIVFFVNHHEILQEIKKKIITHPQKKIIFHAGEFSDSLVFSHITNEFPLYWKFFKNYPSSQLELRSKSNNIQPLLKLGPLNNITISFSISPQEIIQKYEHKTPSFKSRLLAIKNLNQKGFPIGIHLDPIIFHNKIESNYTTLIEQLFKSLPNINLLKYISLGVVRFPKRIFNEVKKNYLNSEWLKENFSLSFDKKYRYVYPLRKWLLRLIQEKLLKIGVKKEKIYFCMEN